MTTFLLHSTLPMSSITTHIFESDEDEPRPSFRTMDALRAHFQKYIHLHNVEFLHNKEYYTSIHDLIWLNRAEISGMWNTVRNIEDRLEAMEREVREGFSALKDDLAKLKSLTRGMYFLYELHALNQRNLMQRTIIHIQMCLPPLDVLTISTEHMAPLHTLIIGHPGIMGKTNSPLANSTDSAWFATASSPIPFLPMLNTSSHHHFVTLDSSLHTADSFTLKFLYSFLSCRYSNAMAVMIQFEIMLL